MSPNTNGWAPHRVLIGYDGSEGAADAVAFAKNLCAGTAAEVRLVNVLPFPGPPPVASTTLDGDEAREWDAFYRDAEATLAPLHVEHETYVARSPAKVLDELTENEEFDLVVVGSPHRGAIGRAVLGSVAEGLMHGATVPVVAAPRGYSQHDHDGFARIVVGYDGTPEADEAVEAGTAIARRDDIPLHLVAVTTPPIAAPGPFAGPIPSLLPDAPAVVARGVKSVAADVDVHGEALRGAVEPALTEYCGPADLLILGSRGYGPVARTLLGSISSALIHTAPCPVLVVPRPERATEQAAHDDAVVAEVA